ncbi:MAG: transposase [Deltaproteobacteria bacterium]|nr:transposase [Deltaproteobacteria bacterium]
MNHLFEVVVDKNAIYIPVSVFWFRRVDGSTDCARAGLLAEREGIASYIEAQLQAVEQLNLYLAALDKNLTQLAKPSSLCRRLMTVPGVGPVVAIRYEAALDTIKRFGSAHDVLSSARLDECRPEPFAVLPLFRVCINLLPDSDLRRSR